MPVIDRSDQTVGGLLKDVFEGPINNNINSMVMMLMNLRPTSAYMKGAEKIEHPVQLVPNTSVGFRTNTTTGAATLPGVAGSETKNVKTLIKTLYAYMEFYGHVLRIGKTDKSAYAEVFQNEVSSVSNTMRREINRALHLDGRGILGVVAATPTNVDDIVVGLDSTNTTVAANMLWFEKGMFLDILDPATGNKRYSGGFRISVKDKATRTLTLVDGSTALAIGNLADGTYNVLANDWIVVQNNYNNEPYGVLAIGDDGTNTSSFLNISEVTYDRWRGVFSDNSGTLRALTETILQDFLDELEPWLMTQAADGNGAGIKRDDLLCMTTTAIRNKIARIIKAGGLTSLDINLEGGYKALGYNGYPIYADVFGRYGQLSGTNKTTVVPHQLSEGDQDSPYKFTGFSFDDLDGSVLHSTRQSEIYYAKGLINYNFTCKNRQANGVIVDIDASL